MTGAGRGPRLREEQEAARPEITEVAPGVLRFQLPIRLPGLGHVNCYGVPDSRGIALVDPGLPGPGNRRALGDRLNRAGFRLQDVHTIVVTHAHPDHFGAAASIAHRTGATIVAHRDFVFLRSKQARTALLRASEAPPSVRLRLGWRAFEWIAGAALFPSLTRDVVDGEPIDLGDSVWRVIHTPGHTRDHICLHEPATRTFLAGDHVLPTITPHVSGFAAGGDPLLDYRESLASVARLEVTRVLPAHGHPFADLRGRIAEIQSHHDERLEQLRRVGRTVGPVTLATLSRRLFPGRVRSWMAESETLAHLLHLVRLGAAERIVRRHRRPLYVLR